MSLYSAFITQYFPMTPKLLILGDSISLGVSEVRGSDIVDRVDTNYIEMLSHALPGAQIIVDADVHRTTAVACKSIDSLLATHQPTAVLVMLGGNDADLDWKRFVLSNGAVVRCRLSLEAYEANLRDLVKRILAAGAAVVLTDMPNHHFEFRGPYVSKLANLDVTSMLDRGGGQAASDQSLLKYRAVVTRIAAEMLVSVVRYGEILDAYPPREMVGIDGAHPSSTAHRLIAEALTPALLRVLRPPTPRRLTPVIGLSA
jgi:lysophospholipase L1-like esterase